VLPLERLTGAFTVHCEVRTGCSYAVYMHFSLQSLYIRGVSKKLRKEW